MVQFYSCNLVVKKIATRKIIPYIYIYIYNFAMLQTISLDMHNKFFNPKLK
jgi:hypothetical protein